MTVTRESAILELQHAIFDMVDGNEHVKTTHDCRIYDYVPQEVIAATKPYIEIGDPTETPWDCLGDEYGQRLTQRLHVWSTYRGKKEAADIIKHLKEILDNQPMTITGYGHVWTVCEFATVLKDPDNIHYHGICDLGVNVTQS